MLSALEPITGALRQGRSVNLAALLSRADTDFSRENQVEKHILHRRPLGACLTGHSHHLCSTRYNKMRLVCSLRNLHVSCSLVYKRVFFPLTLLIVLILSEHANMPPPHPFPCSFFFLKQLGIISPKMN